MSVFIIAGSMIIMFCALNRYRKCMSLVEEVHYSKNWRLLMAMIWFFIIAYAAYGYSLIAGYKISDQRHMITTIFFLGAVFVFFITSLNHKIFSQVAELNREIRRHVDHLEEEVKLRTEELETLSVTDNLTGLFNQRYFYRKLEEESYRANRQKGQVFLILFDVDKFKAYNDTYGHLAGDKALQIVGKTIRESIRTHIDTGCRYGGDEFTIILPDINREQAIVVARRILNKLNEYDIEISMGLIPCRGCDSKNPKRFLKLADQAMYAAKHEGGNRIKLYLPVIEPSDDDTPENTNDAAKWSCI